MAIFNPKAHQKRIGNLSSYTKMNVEHDEDLYFDENDQQFFVVHSTESAIPPNASPNYSTRNVSKEEVKNLAAKDPEIAANAAEYLD